MSSPSGYPNKTFVIESNITKEINKFSFFYMSYRYYKKHSSNFPKTVTDYLPTVGK